MSKIQVKMPASEAERWYRGQVKELAEFVSEDFGDVIKIPFTYVSSYNNWITDCERKIEESERRIKQIKKILKHARVAQEICAKQDRAYYEG